MRARRAVICGARNESTPKACAVWQMANHCASLSVNCSQCARACAMSAASKSVKISSWGDSCRKSSHRPKRSAKLLGKVFSSSKDSSKATTPKRAGRLSVSRSCACRMRASTLASSRSAMGKITTPCSAWASKPGCHTEVPCASEAVRSKPPSKRSSSTLKGTRTQGVTLSFKKASHWSRTGPWSARTQAPPRAMGLTAKAASAHPSSDPAWDSERSVGFTTPRLPAGPVARGHRSRCHPAGCAASGAAARGAPRVASLGGSLWPCH